MYQRKGRRPPPKKCFLTKGPPCAFTGFAFRGHFSQVSISVRYCGSGDPGPGARPLTLDDLLSDPLPIDGCVCIHTKEMS